MIYCFEIHQCNFILEHLNHERRGKYFLLPSQIFHQIFISVQCLNCVELFATPWTAAHMTSLSTTNSQSLFKLFSIELVMPSNHLILCRSLLLLPSILPSIRVFIKESVLCMRWPKFWRFNFSIHPSNDSSGLIPFRMDRFDLLAVQGTLKSFLKHHISKASILQCSGYFIIQLSHLHKTTEITIALTRQNFVGNVIFLPLICCLGLLQLFFQGASVFYFHGCSLISTTAVILEPPQIVFHSILSPYV